MCLLAGAIVMSAAANAFYYDATVSIDRALNSPTLTVRYTGATVALVELRVNGVSVGTRTISSTKNAGETNFTLDLAALRAGDNEVEVRLFDKAGKLVGTQNSSIATEDGTQGPVFLSTPKVGATVMGPVEIKLGFGRAMRNVYVSFFIDNQFKSMINNPPFSMLWDTATETNGWHEVEAWVIDDSSTTFKTKKIKVFVNNPGGNTVREKPVEQGKDPKVEVKPEPKKVDLRAKSNPVGKGSTSGDAAGMKDPKGSKSAPVGSGVKTTEPGTNGLVSGNPLKVSVGSAVGTKGTKMPGAYAAGPKHLTPTGTRVAVAVPSNTVTSATRMIQVNYGQKLPNLPTYSIILNSQYVEFDVNPRVTDGVPLTPFRHLIERAGGEVNWDNGSKIVDAKSEGHEIWIKIGDRYAKINSLPVKLEMAPFIERGRTIVPLSFIKSSLDVNIDFDPTTGHVLITSKK
jgi:hypothetical protein